MPTNRRQRRLRLQCFEATLCGKTNLKRTLPERLGFSSFTHAKKTFHMTSCALQ